MCSSDLLRFVVQDDGQGFDTMAGHEGLGITTMRQRASMVGGTLDVSSEPGKGTRIALGIPVPLREEA